MKGLQNLQFVSPKIEIKHRISIQIYNKNG